jgi:hypothetical protein
MAVQYGTIDARGYLKYSSSEVRVHTGSAMVDEPRSNKDQVGGMYGGEAREQRTETGGREALDSSGSIT